MIIDEVNMNSDLAEMDGEQELQFPDMPPQQAFQELPDDVIMGATEDEITAFFRGY